MFLTNNTTHQQKCVLCVVCCVLCAVCCVLCAVCCVLCAVCCVLCVVCCVLCAVCCCVVCCVLCAVCCVLCAVCCIFIHTYFFTQYKCSKRNQKLINLDHTYTYTSTVSELTSRTSPAPVMHQPILCLKSSLKKSFRNIHRDPALLCFRFPLINRDVQSIEDS